MVSFRSCSWWLYKASPSSAAKNIMNLILYWPSGDVHVYSHFLGCWKRAFVWLACSFDKTLLAFALLHFVLQGQTYLLLWVSLDLLLLHSNPLWWKGYLFFFFHASSRRSCRSSQNQSTSASWASVAGAWTGITVRLNGLPWKRTETILSFLRLHPSSALQTPVDYEGYSIFS